jgi:hypothetical protein
MATTYIMLLIPVLAIIAASALISYIILHVTHKDMPKGEIRTTHSKEEGDTVTLTQSRYDELLKAELMLEALSQSGVDNWSGYGEAQDLFHEWQKDDDIQATPE